MTSSDSNHLVDAYSLYIDCLNSRDLNRLNEFVAEDVHYNGQRLGIQEYRNMIEGNYRDIPDLQFVAQLVVEADRIVGSRLNFDCSPKGRFLDLEINGKRIRFSENVFYEYVDGKISSVWSVIDKTAIERQLFHP